MTNIIWTPTSWKDYMEWQQEDKKTVKRIHALILDIQRNGPFKGIGKPEPLRYRPEWSRRIVDSHRLVYRMSDAGLVILSCKGHYEDK